ncbi:transcriptional regulator GlvR [Neisseria wadsworthii 9715]|uniref:Transcriptional regulator GlvR n=1 Tax=Neisseria wadsworthii 9715 TaxID=1030841 RepID=G4CSD3_9NEIS|nr:transcriptional regulator GlvR [Neisseria wadsworthii 9715]
MNHDVLLSLLGLDGYKEFRIVMNWPGAGNIRHMCWRPDNVP